MVSKTVSFVAFRATWLLITTFFLTVLAGLGYAGINDPPDISSVIKQINICNQRLVNLEVHFEMHEFAQHDGKDWIKTGLYQKGTGWFNGKAKSKGRISYDSYSLRWTGGPAGFFETKSEFGYDGLEGRSVVHAIIRDGKQSPHREGEIAATADPRLFNSIETQASTGGLFSSNFHDATTTTDLASEFEQAKLSGATLACSMEELDGLNLIHVSMGYPAKAKEDWWFDATRGYALIGDDLVVNNQLVKKIRVTNLTEASPNIWYPTDATCEMKVNSVSVEQDGSPPQVRYVYHASLVVANRKGFDEGIYQIKFPPDCNIVDTVRGVKYKTAPEPKVLETDLTNIANTSLAQMSPEERVLMPQANDANSIGAADSPVVAAVPIQPAHSFFSKALFLAIGLTISLVVFVLFRSGGLLRRSH